MIVRRLIELLGLLMIGDGMLGTFQMQRHMRLWENGPHPYEVTMQALIDRPLVTRVLSVTEVLLGLWLASTQRPQR